MLDCVGWVREPAPDVLKVHRLSPVRATSCMQAAPELALMSTAAGGAAQLVAEALRAGEGAVRPDLLQVRILPLSVF